MPLSFDNICAMNFHYQRYPLEAFLDDAAELGLTQVEIWGAAPHFYVGDRTRSDARELRNQARARNLKIACFTPEQCVYPINLASPQEKLRNRSVRYFEQCLEMCAEMASPALLVTPGSGYANEPAALAWDRCVNSLGTISKRAEELGITLYLECLPPAWSNVATTARDLARLLAVVGSSAIRSMMDTSAAVLSEESVSDYAAELKSSFAHMHMTDADVAGSHLAWGDGMLDLDLYLAELQTVGYQGALSLELTNSRYYLDPKPALEQSVEKLSAAIGRLA